MSSDTKNRMDLLSREEKSLVGGQEEEEEEAASSGTTSNLSFWMLCAMCASSVSFKLLRKCPNACSCLPRLAGRLLVSRRQRKKVCGVFVCRCVCLRGKGGEGQVQEKM